LVSSLPLAVLVLGAGSLVGAATVGWLVPAAALVVAVVSAGHLVGGPPLRRVSAGLLYAVNPFVFERFGAGQFVFLAGYSLLPFAARATWRLCTGRRQGLGPVAEVALWIAVLTGCSIHFFFIGLTMLVVLSAVVVRTWRGLAQVAGVGAVTVVLNGYLLFAAHGSGGPRAVPGAELLAFRTRGHGVAGVYGNLLTMYGFWRRGPRLPRDLFPGWWVVFLGLAAVTVTGWAFVARRHPRAGVALGVLATTGVVLGAGDRGPFGPAFSYAVDHVPFLGVMREPQKFACLFVLAASCCFGFGAQRFVDMARGWRPAWALVALALPLAYTPTQVWGLGGALRPVAYPASWLEAREIVRQGDGRVLVLPWHAYLAFPFTGRVVANPGTSMFGRQAIVGDNIELQQQRTDSHLDRSRYLEDLFDRPEQACNFGRLVAPLGVEYVFLAKTVDWKKYTWISDQADIEVAAEWPDAALLRNRSFLGRAYATSGGPEGECGAASAGETVDQLRASEVAARVRVRSGPEVVLTEPFDPSWRAEGRRPRITSAGSMVFETGNGVLDIRYSRWPLVRAGYVLSSASGVVCLALVVVGRRRSSSATSA
jgi:hypothetical protein